MANARQAGFSPLPDPVSLESVITSASALFGMLAGLAWMNAHGGFSAGGSFGQKTLRMLIGLLGLLVFYYLLGLLFPKGTTLPTYTLLYLRYALIGAWISGGAPWTFKKLRLA